MKKSMLVFLIISLTSINCSQNEPLTLKEKGHKNSIEAEDLLSKVKSIDRILYMSEIPINNLDSIKQSEGWNEKKFNEKGYIIEYNDYKQGGILISKSIYKYNTNENIIEKNRWNTDGVMVSKTFYNYDDKKNLIEELNFTLNELIDDRFENKVKVNNWDSNNVMLSKTLYNYDNIGNRIEKIVYNHNAKISDKYIYEYSNSGYLVEEKWYNPNDELSTKNTFKYDSQGNNIKLNIYDGYGNLSYEHLRKFDKKGNLKEFTDKNIKKKQTDKWSRKHDDRNNVIEENYVDPNGFKSKTTYEFEFDSKNNWIKKTVFLDGDQGYVDERVIKYYE